MYVHAYICMYIVNIYIYIYVYLYIYTHMYMHMFGIQSSGAIVQDRCTTVITHNIHICVYIGAHVSVAILAQAILAQAVGRD